MNAKIIFNPKSGTGAFLKKFESVLGKLILNNIINNIKSYKIDDNLDLNKSIIENADFYDIYIAVGGDGTIHNVINKMAINNIKVPILIIPAGTVNDFGNYLKIPKEEDKLYELIKDFKVQNIDLCMANSKYFINVAAAGLLADIAITTPKQYKSMLGSLAYYAHGISEVPKQLFKDLRFKFITKEKEFDLDAYLFLVLNTTNAGGFTNMAPKASLDDGLFDVCIIKKSFIISAASVFFKIFSGEHINDNNVLYFQTDYLKVKCINNDDLILDLDGEHGGFFPCEFKIAKNKLNIVIPKETK